MEKRCGQAKVVWGCGGTVPKHGNGFGEVEREENVAEGGGGGRLE